MNPVEKVKEKSLKNKVLALNAKNVDEEVQSYKDKLQTYGIKNKTVNAINNSFKEIEKEKEEIGKGKALNLLINAFAPFSIVEYKTLDDVCNDHKLIISSISNYDKAIPDENLEEIDIFVDRLKSMDTSVLDKVQANINHKFTFDDKYYLPFISKNSYVELIGTESMFKIAAPKSHFTIPKNHIKIGNEYHSMGVEKPKFSYTPSFHVPKIQLDPIVFIPIKFLDRIYCVIVTAWDKEADDSRILSKL